MKYSKNFERDYNWYLTHKDQFTFDGSLDTSDKVIFSENGKSAKDCFYIYDSSGQVVQTKEPELLHKIFKCKGSVNLNIKMWAEDLANGTLPTSLFKDICNEFNLLPWMIDAVEKQKIKYRHDVIL